MSLMPLGPAVAQSVIGGGGEAPAPTTVGDERKQSYNGQHQPRAHACSLSERASIEAVAERA